jgi:hypothetical protein
MIVVEGVSDCLEMERRNSSATYVAGGKLQLISIKILTTYNNNNNNNNNIY